MDDFSPQGRSLEPTRSNIEHKADQRTILTICKLHGTQLGDCPCGPGKILSEYRLRLICVELWKGEQDPRLVAQKMTVSYSGEANWVVVRYEA